MNKPARERYSKHVKALVLVGSMRDVAAASDSVDYESKWATLSFALR